MEVKRWALLGAVLLAGCASRTTTFGEETPGSEGYRVRLFVHPDLPIAARVTATALPGSEPVAYVRIRVDGEVVAEAHGRDGGVRGGGGMPESFWVEAQIPERGGGRGPSERDAQVRGPPQHN